MEKGKKVPEKSSELEEDLHFDLEDLSAEEIGLEPAEEHEEIIELVDLIERGVDPGRPAADEFEDLLKDEQLTEDKGSDEPVEELTELDKLMDEDELADAVGEEELPELSLFADAEEGSLREGDAGERAGEDDLGRMLDEEIPDESLDLGGLEGEIPAAEEAKGEEIGEDALKDLLEGGPSDFDLSLSEKAEVESEEPTQEAFAEGDLKGELFEEGLDELELDRPSPGDDKALEQLVEEAGLELGPETLEDPLLEESVGTVAEEESKVTEVETGRPAPDLPEKMVEGISEEKIEEVVTRVVQEVVERVTRETVKEIAESIVKDAVESIREGLQSAVTQSLREEVDRATRETVSQVAESVITEAINALKESLESAPK